MQLLENVDLYLGGSEHATGHLIYARFWNMFLYDLGVACEEEPFKKLINQGMIQGRSNFVYRIQGTNTFVSVGLKDQYKTTEIHVDVNIVKNDVLDQDAFRAWMPEYANAEFILENGKYICGWAIEKMSKSMFNVVNPDTIIEEYGARARYACTRCSSDRWNSANLGTRKGLTGCTNSYANSGACSKSVKTSA